MSAEDEMSTEEAGRRFLLAYRRLRAAHSGDTETLREYEDALNILLATFADTIGNVSLSATACSAYCCALVHSAENVKRSHAKVVARASAKSGTGEN